MRCLRWVGSIEGICRSAFGRSGHLRSGALTVAVSRQASDVGVSAAEPGTRMAWRADFSAFASLLCLKLSARPAKRPKPLLRHAISVSAQRLSRPNRACLSRTPSPATGGSCSTSTAVPCRRAQSSIRDCLCVGLWHAAARLPRIGEACGCHQARGLHDLLARTAQSVRLEDGVMRSRMAANCVALSASCRCNSSARAAGASREHHDLLLGDAFKQGSLRAR